MFGIVVLFVGLVIVCNSLFLKSYYTHQKETALTECFDYVSSLDLSDPKLVQKLQSLEENKNIEILIIDYQMRIFFCTKGAPDTLFLPLDEQGDLDERWFREWLMPNNDKDASVEIFSSKPQLGRRYSEELAAQYLTLYAKATKNYNDVDFPFYIIINTPMSAIEDAVNVANKFTLIIGAVIITLGSILTLALGRKLTEPIYQINQAAKKISQLDFTQPLAVDSKDELGELAESVNNLSNELESKIRELSLANEQLKLDIINKNRIDSMRRELISNVSHDLKTPLSIILGYCEGLQANINNEDKEYYCSVIEDETLRMSSIVSTLLKLAELESGASKPEMAIFNFSALAGNRFEKISYLMKERNIETSFDSQDEFYVNGDHDRIEEVLNNLLSNALHHSLDGGHISLKLYSSENDVVCEVYNKGEPIPEESLDMIWESFYKVDKSRSRTYGGSGLGLKIVSTILDSHNSSYKAENTADGVVFSFRLKKELPPLDDGSDNIKEEPTHNE